jgi:N-acetylmuramoyl-L-alanine amidase
MKIAISSGHGKYIRGASGSPVPPQLDEVDEARKVVETVADFLRARGVATGTFHDNTSHDQSTNLHTIVAWHNAQARDLDVSVHFNAYDHSAHGTEVLYVTQQTLAAEVASAIADAGGFTNRGAKYRSDLYVLNNTEEPAILIEVCFCDNTSDSNRYHQNYDAICSAIAGAIAPEREPVRPVQPEPEPPCPPEFPANQSNIICTVFGGKTDPNNSAYEPYDVITDSETSCALPYRFADPRPQVRVRNTANSREVICEIRDIGPWNTNDPYWQTGARPQAESGTDMTGRTTNGAGIDLTPGAAKKIGIKGKGKVDWTFVEEPVVA